MARLIVVEKRQSRRLWQVRVKETSANELPKMYQQREMTLKPGTGRTPG